jgi:polysulfide reductase chain C
MEHFVQPPRWEWYILLYFFLGGLSGGTYALATMLAWWGGARDRAVARAGYLIAFPIAAVCPILLTVDLGQPFRFYHMLLSTTPGQGGLMFHYWSPMSVGSWALLVFGIFSFVSFLAALSGSPSGGGRLITGLGSLVGLYFASYTGVLLSVSNQPIWSDTWVLGGLFLASALCGSAALLSWFAHRRRETWPTEGRLHVVDGAFAVIELIWIALFFLTLTGTGSLGSTLAEPWLILWALVVISLITPLLFGGRRGREARSMPARAAGSAAPAVALIVLLGSFLVRLVVIFSAQM